LSLPCGNLEMYLDVQPARCLGDLLGAGPGLEPEMVLQALAAHPSGVRVLAGARSHAVESLTRSSMGPILDALGDDGALTVVDMGSFLEMAHATVLERADLVVVPVTPLISSLGTLGKARELLDGFGVSGDRLLPVLNHAGPDMPALGADMVARLMGGAPRHVLPWGGAEVARSLNEGVPLVIGHATSPLAEAIDGLARDTLVRLGLGVLERPHVADSRASSPLAWLLGLFSPKGVTHVHP
jgi:Flp pilus assembly CpaE family ATPase